MESSMKSLIEIEIRKNKSNMKWERTNSSVVYVIYHGLVFFLEKHGSGFAIYSRVCMEIRVAEFAWKLWYSVCKRIK